MNWDDVRIFKVVAENGSIRKAANELGLSHSTLSRRIENLENALRTKLFYRLSTGLALTDTGTELLSASLPMSIEFDRIERKLVGRDHSIDGEIKITLPGVLASHMLFVEMLKFQEQWPQISLQIHTSNDIADLASGEADIAIRLTNAPDESLVGRKVCDIYQAAYASKEYVSSLKNNDSQDIKWVKPGSLTTTMNTQLDSDTNKSNECELIINHIDLQLHAIEMHKGVALLPCFVADKNDNLLRVSKPYHHFCVWLLCTKELRDNKRMQLFRKFITERLREHTPLFEGKTKPLFINNNMIKPHEYA